MAAFKRIVGQIGFLNCNLLKKKNINDDDDRDEEDRRAYRSPSPRKARQRQANKGPSYENVSPYEDQAEVHSHASCTTKSTFA